MRFVLNKRIKMGYSFGQWTFYNTNHKGQDYQANYWNLYAPRDCYVDTFSDVGGGNWVQFHFDNVVIQCAHISKFIKTGQVKEGELVAITGNSGKYTTGPHLHLQMKINGVLVDPEQFNWENSMEFDEAKDRALTEAFYGTSPWAQKIREDIDYLQKVRLGEKGGDNIAVRVAKLENIAPVSPVLSADDQNNLNLLKRLIEALKNIFK